MKKKSPCIIWMVVLIGCLLSGGQGAQARDKFLLLNYSPDGFSTYASSSEIMNYVKQKFGAANQASSLKVGVACLYYPGASWGGISKELTLMQNDLARAKTLGIPILIQVDTENWLPVSLLNWYDPSLPGYNPAKTVDVEWYGWDQSTAVALCWRNWGYPFRIGPAPNLLSANFQAHEKAIYDQFLAAVLQWYNSLAPSQKWLFVGWKCGWESTVNDNYRFFANGNSYYNTPNDPPWSDNYQPLGYNAAQTSGIRTNGTITTSDLAKVVGKHLGYLARMAAEAGIPRDKLFVHGVTYGTYQQNSDALVNAYGNPGASFYGSSDAPLKSNTAFMQAVQAAEANYGATGYAYGEFNLFTDSYSTWHTWFTNALYGDPRCVYQALFNYDSMYGRASVEQAMLDAMALYPAANTPTIPTQPSSLTVGQGSSAAFTVTATGAGTLSYQWRFNSTNIPNARSASYHVNRAEPTHAGGYSVIVSNSFGATTSKLAFLSVLLPATNPPGCILAPGGLVNWWPADGNAHDILANLTGTPKNGFSYASGKARLAFCFDGSTSCLNLMATNIRTSWTACFWVKRQDAPGPSAVLMADDAYSLKLEQYNGTRQVGITRRGVADYVFNPGYIAPAGTWVHLAFVGNSTSTVLFVNGVSNSIIDASIPLPRSYMGANYVVSSGKNSDFMLGCLDEILVFNRALSSAEINAVYSAGEAGFYRAPVLTFASQTGEQFCLNLLGLTGKGFTVYSSTNLAHWNTVATLTNPNGTSQYVGDHTVAPVKFFRVSQP